MRAAVKAKAMAAAAPNMAAFQAGDPIRVSMHGDGGAPDDGDGDEAPVVEARGLAAAAGRGQARKAANPPAAKLAPTHSCQPRCWRNQMPRMATRKGSSRVRMGWTSVRRPKWRAVN
jgi:hypothetical protein